MRTWSPRHLNLHTRVVLAMCGIKCFFALKSWWVCIKGGVVLKEQVYAHLCNYKGLVVYGQIGSKVTIRSKVTDANQWRDDSRQ